MAENSAGGVNVGVPIIATDPDGDTLTYSLSGADAGAFSIDAGTGQVTTIDGITYDYEVKSAYSLVVSAADEGGLAVSIPATVNLTDVNEAPAFDEGASATRQVAENSASGVNVGAASTATDPDGDTLTYTLSGADAGSFDLSAATGQLTTREGVAYDYESKSTYAVTVTAEDPEGASASISVTVSITDVEETPPEPEPTPLASCFTDLGSLTGAAEFSGAWDGRGLPGPPPGGQSGPLHPLHPIGGNRGEHHPQVGVGRGAVRVEGHAAERLGDAARSDL